MRAPIQPIARRGFTLLGVLILVAILGMAAAATVTAGFALQRRAAEEDLLFVGMQYRNAFKSYYESAVAAQRYPTNLNDLLRDPRFPGVRRHLRKLYTDPITGKAEWGTLPAPGGGIMGVYSLSTDKPIKVALFPPEFSGFEGKESYADWVFAFVAPTSAPGGAQSAAGAQPAVGAQPATGPGAAGATNGAMPAAPGQSATPLASPSSGALMK